MPKYIYTAKGYSGETKGGEIAAKDEKSLAQQMRSEGFVLTSVKLIEEQQAGVEVKFLDRFQTVPLKEKMMFARNLGIMVASGLPTPRAVNNLAKQTRNKRFQKILSDIFEEVQAGKSLSEGLAKYPGVFGELFINMVKVGEIGGNLEEVLDIVATQLEKEHDIVSKVRGAMIYPAVILTVMAGIGVIMLTYVLPKLLGVFKDMNAELPPLTKMIISISDIFSQHSVLVLVSIVVLVIFVKLFLQQPIGKKILSFVTIHVPVVNNIIIKMNCARFARIYSSLLKSGINAIDALRIISNTLTNYYYKRALEKSIEDIQKGMPLSKIISGYPDLFPVLVPQIIEVGEETGKTESVLLKLAEFYEDEVSAITKNMSSIIEPVLMVIIGVAVGIFAVGMLQPMYSLMDNIK
jgi:type IV pilus assembly protein PilC